MNAAIVVAALLVALVVYLRSRAPSGYLQHYAETRAALLELHATVGRLTGTEPERTIVVRWSEPTSKRSSVAQILPMEELSGNARSAMFRWGIPRPVTSRYVEMIAELRAAGVMAVHANWWPPSDPIRAHYRTHGTVGATLALLGEHRGGVLLVAHDHREWSEGWLDDDTARASYLKAVQRVREVAL